MVSAADASAAIAHALPAIDNQHLQDLMTSTGYAYQAYAMVTIGDHTTQATYDWWHPAAGPTFSKAHGVSLAAARAQFSRLQDKPPLPGQPQAAPHPCPCAVAGVQVNGPRDMAIIQSVKWAQRSAVEHAMDVSVTCHDNLVAIIECKNRVDKPGISTGRDMMGAWADIRPKYVHLRGGAQRPLRLALISANGATQRAVDYLKFYRGIVLELGAPYNPAGQLHWPCDPADCILCNVVLA